MPRIGQLVQSFREHLLEPQESLALAEHALLLRYPTLAEALKVKPRQQLEWIIQDDGTAVVRSRPSALSLFASLKPAQAIPGLKAEKEAVKRLVAERAAKEGLK